MCGPGVDARIEGQDARFFFPPPPTHWQPTRAYDADATTTTSVWLRTCAEASRMRSGSQLTARRKRETHETHAASPAAAAHDAPGSAPAPAPPPPRGRLRRARGSAASSTGSSPRAARHGQNSTHAGPSTPSTSSRRTDAQPHTSTQRSPSPQSCHAPPVELGSRSWRKKPAASIMSHHLVPASRGQGWPPCVSCTRSCCGHPPLFFPLPPPCFFLPALNQIHPIAR